MVDVRKMGPRCASSSPGTDLAHLAGEYDERADAAKEAKECNHRQETESQKYFHFHNLITIN